MSFWSMYIKSISEAEPLIKDSMNKIREIPLGILNNKIQVK